MKKIAIYVDAQHLWHAARRYGQTVGIHTSRADYEALLGVLIEAAKKRTGDSELEIVRQDVYSVSRNRALRFSQALGRLGYDVHDHILKSSTDSWDWDTQITADAIRDAPLVDLVIVVSGDGDLSPAVQAVRETGTDAVAVGFPGSTSSRFDEPILLDDRVLYSTPT